MPKHKRALAAAGGSIGTGVLASLSFCCAMPWAVPLLGVTGAIALARLAPYQNALVLASLVLLCLAFYWGYRGLVSHRTECVVSSRDRAVRWVLWIAAVLFVASSVFVLLVPR